MKYAEVTRNGRNYNKRWNDSPNSQKTRLEELNRPTNQTFNPDELVDVYLYVTLVGNLGLIRRTLIQDLFKWREDMVLKPVFKFSPKPTWGLEFDRLCVRRKKETVVNELERRKIEQLPTVYKPLYISPRSNNMDERKERALKIHCTEVLTNWEKCARNPRDEAVAQLFESLINQTKGKLNSKEQ